MYGHDGQDYPEKETLSEQEKKSIMNSAVMTFETMKELIKENVLWSNIDTFLAKAHTKIEDIGELDLTPDQLEQKLRTIKTCIDSALDQLEERNDNE